MKQWKKELAALLHMLLALHIGDAAHLSCSFKSMKQYFLPFIRLSSIFHYSVRQHTHTHRGKSSQASTGPGVWCKSAWEASLSCGLLGFLGCWRSSCASFASLFSSQRQMFFMVQSLSANRRVLFVSCEFVITHCLYFTHYFTFHEPPWFILLMSSIIPEFVLYCYWL